MKLPPSYHSPLRCRLTDVIVRRAKNVTRHPYRSALKYLHASGAAAYGAQTEEVSVVITMINL